MSIRLQLFEYKYDKVEGTQFILDSSFASSAAWDLGVGWAVSGGSANHSGGDGYLRQHNLNFVQGETYRIKYKISGRTSGSLILANHLDNNTNGFIQNTNGSFEYDWVQGSNSSKLNLEGWSNFDGSVEYAKVYHITGIDWDNSIVGELDVTNHSEFPLALTFAISDIRKTDANSGSFSKTFKIPATKNNNQLLKSIYVSNAVNESNVLNKLKCRIITDDLYSLSGSLKITAIGQVDKPSYYSVVFYGSNLVWANELDGKYLHQIDWGADGEDLVLDKTGIMDSWHQTDSTTTASPVVYPIVSYGRYNKDGDLGNIQLLNTANNVINQGAGGVFGYNNSSVSYGTPLPELDWRPAIWVKDTFDRIFSAIGYQISSNFMDSDMFKQLVWALPNAKYNNPDERYCERLFDGNFNNEGFISSATNSTSGWTSTSSYINPSDSADFNIISDDFNKWDALNGYLEFGESGYYDIELKGFGFYISTLNFSRVAEVIFSVKLRTVGQSSWVTVGNGELNYQEQYAGSASSGTNNGFKYPDVSFNRYFNKGDEIRIHSYVNVKKGTGTQTLNYFGSTTPTSSTTSSSANARFSSRLNSELMEYGQTYNLRDVIDKKYSQMDFIKGIAHAFNLQFTTDEGVKILSIEPFNDFYSPLSDAIDYTHKLDRSKEITDKFIETDLKKNIVFKYKSDSEDEKVKYRGKTYFEGIEDEFPYEETLSDEFKKGDSKFENPFFAGTYSCRDMSITEDTSISSMFYSGALWGENTSSNSKATRSDKGNGFLPRLLYYNTYLNSVGTKAFSLQYWGAGYGGVSSGYYNTEIPQATSNDSQNINSPNLCYGNVWVDNFDKQTGIYAPSASKKGLYEEYHKGKIDMIKQSPRIRTTYIDLKIGDIIGLDFRKLIYIDGSYWRLNKIIDFNPNQKTSTKVELVEWLDLGESLASNPKVNPSILVLEPAPDDSDNSAF